MADKKKPKIYKKIDPDEIAKALGAKHITDPKEIEEFKKKYFPRHKKITGITPDFYLKKLAIKIQIRS